MVTPAGSGNGGINSNPMKLQAQAHVVGEPDGVSELTSNIPGKNGPSCVQLPPVTDKPAGQMAVAKIGGAGKGGIAGTRTKVEVVTGIRPFRGLLTQVPFS